MALTDRDIRQTASDLIRKVWTERAQLGIQSNEPLEVLHVAPRIAAEKLLLLQIVEVPEISPSASEQIRRIRIAGVLSKLEKKVYLSKAFRTISRRFTLCHEIGHFLLHPANEIHRDRPLEGYISEPRPQIEREADLFAAEFLMPRRQLSPLFQDCFGDPIVVSPRDSGLAYKLSVGTGQNLLQVQRVMSYLVCK